MIKIDNIELEFDITSPSDVLRYKQAGERMEAEGQELAAPEVREDDPHFLDQYVAMLNDELRLFGNFIDEVFGDGIAERLLGNNPSLNRVAEITGALAEAMETSGRDYGVRLQKYRPNRATRRAH